MDRATYEARVREMVQNETERLVEDALHFYDEHVPGDAPDDYVAPRAGMMWAAKQMLHHIAMPDRNDARRFVRIIGIPAKIVYGPKHLRRTL